MSNESTGWRLGKVIDAPMLIALLIQTGGVVWYGGQLVKTVELQGQQIAEINMKVNRLIEAQGGHAASSFRLQVIEQELNSLRLKAERIDLDLARGNRGRPQ